MATKVVVSINGRPPDRVQQIMSAHPHKEARGPFGASQIRLFEYIRKHPGCSMNEIRDDEFPDKQGNYVWNLVRENIYYIDKREIGTGIPDELYLKMTRIGEVIDLKAFIVTGKYIRKAPLEQTAMSFPEQPPPQN
jgi:hypothetical protein